MFSLWHFIALPWTKEVGNQDIKSNKEAIRYCKERKITAPILVCGVYSFNKPRLICPDLELVQREYFFF